MVNRYIYCRRERGQAALFMTMTLTISLGLIGLVVDEGWGYWRQEACLTAAQAAAMGGIMFAKNNNTTWPPSTCNTTSTIICQTTQTACPTNLTLGTAPTTDVQAACLYAQRNGFMATGKQNVTIVANTGNPTTASGVTTSYYITARATELIPLTFLSAIAGRTGNLVSAIATAAVVSSTLGSCIYVLDSASTSHALEADNDAQISASCGIWVDSTSSTAAHATGSATVKTTGTTQPPIKVVGTAVTDNNGSFSPSATDNSASVSDPLAGLEVPWTNCTGGSCPTVNCEYTGCTGSATHCDHTNFSVTTANGGTPQVLTPGIYCGGISVSNGSSVTFNSGMYVINGGGVNIQSGSQNSGSGVIFYLTGTNANYGGFTVGNGVSGLTLSPPASGGLAGVLFYQDRSLTPTSSASTCTNQGNYAGSSAVCGGASMKLQGIIYLPTTAMAFTNGTNTAATMSIVVKDVTFDGGSYLIAADPYGTLAGSAAKVAMVQ
jgi:hypothetical protein